MQEPSTKTPAGADAVAPGPRGSKTAGRGLRSRLTELEGELHRARLLLAISQTLGACQSTNEALEKLLEMLVAEVGAERGSLFLNDDQTGELYSRVLLGNFKREIRFLNTSGIAGHVFNSGQSTIVHEAYDDERFERSIDEKTGFCTRSILCAPIKTARGEVIGVAQMLNKIEGQFASTDLRLLEVMTGQAAAIIKSSLTVERMQKTREQELAFLDIVADVTSEIKLTTLLQKVMSEATRMLKADRGTLFLNDEKSGELYTEVGQGVSQIRFPNHVGIAGTVFSSGKTVNIPHAYADLRFNPAFDKQTGYFTRSILCVPLVNKAGKAIGVTQMLNKQGGAFTHEDESRLKAFTAQISIALENAKLFDDVQNMKNYNESVLQCMSNGVITIDPDGLIASLQQRRLQILRVRAAEVIGKPASQIFAAPNTWVIDRVRRVEESQKSEVVVDGEFALAEVAVSINLTIVPLNSDEGKRLGSMLLMEDISNEKRIKATMSRYLNPGLADQILESSEDLLGGKSVMATVLFADIRSFTTITERLGAQGTVKLLNEYFTEMVECIQREGGMLDKFIGDAIMAAFGIPVATEDDEDRAVRAAIAMLRELATWNHRRAGHGEQPVAIGIGLNTDFVVSGNIGSPKRMDYTMIGDGVNLAARLESACKTYGARILISENTYRRLKGTDRVREVDLVVVKGKTQPVEIYEVLDHFSEEDFPNLEQTVGHFHNGINHYRARRWDKAIAAFNEAQALNERDPLVRIYLQRSQMMQENEPADDWNGAWVMETK